MGYVTSLFARKVVAAAGDGVDAAALLASVGIAPEEPSDPRQMIPAESYYDMLECIAGQIDATDLPVRTGASMRLDEYGALGLAFKAATTLGASYARVERLHPRVQALDGQDTCEFPKGSVPPLTSTLAASVKELASPVKTARRCGAYPWPS